MIDYLFVCNSFDIHILEIKNCYINITLQMNTPLLVCFLFYIWLNIDKGVSQQLWKLEQGGVCTFWVPGSYNNLANLSLKEINPAIIVHVDNLMIWYSKIIKIRNDDNLVSDKKKKKPCKDGFR